MTSTRRSIVTALSDPDNGILFLNDRERIYNPRNEKTPPPPFFGEILEEDLYDDSQPFYDHELAMKEANYRKIKLQTIKEKLPSISSDGRKLKKKVIYVYERDDDANHNTDSGQRLYSSNKFIDKPEANGRPPKSNNSLLVNAGQR